MGSKPLKWLRDGALMLAAAFALLGLVELGLRLYMGPPAYRFDEQLIAALAPESSKVYLRWVDGGPRFVRWETNEEGFRGPALKHEPELRVMVYGDSNVQARFSTQEESFTGQLAELLRPSVEGELEVINAGVVGYGPDQHLLRFEEDVERYSPDLVLFHIFTENDFGDIVRNRLFELDEAGELQRTPHAVTPDARMPQSWWSRPAGELLSNSMIRIYANAYTQGLARSKEPHPPLEHDPDRFRRGVLKQHAREYAVYADGAPRTYSMFSDHYEGDIAFEPELESAQTKRKLLAAVLGRASEIAAKHSIPFWVLIQPASRDLTRNLPNHFEALEGTPGYDRRRLDRWVEEICEQAGIRHLNLFDLFEATGRTDELYFPSPDPHWNEAGQRLAAEATAERIVESLR